VVLVDGFRKWEWLLKAAYKRLAEEFEKLDVQMNEEKTRIVDLSRDGTFSFLGFDYRRAKTRRGVWGVRVREIRMLRLTRRELGTDLLGTAPVLDPT
jgi:RNA-directed DNA polymerase